MEILMEYMAKGFVTMLTISMPCVLTAAGIGLVVGILQAVTQVQEQTIAAAPKILAVFMVLMIGGYGFVRVLTNLFSDGMAIAFNVVPKSDTYVLSSDYYRYTKPFAKEMQEDFDKNSNFKDMVKQQTSEVNKTKGSPSFNFKNPSGSFSPSPNLMEQRKIMENSR